MSKQNLWTDELCAQIEQRLVTETRAEIAASIGSTVSSLDTYMTAWRRRYGIRRSARSRKRARAKPTPPPAQPSVAWPVHERQADIDRVHVAVVTSVRPWRGVARDS